MGRSNVGKSSLINALVRRRIARTSAAPGKTRLANIYRVVRGGREPIYLVDLPGYGYARGGRKSAAEFERLTSAYFSPVRPKADTTTQDLRAGPGRFGLGRAALLLVDSRHPGLESDREAWTWLRNTVEAAAVVATKTDKLSRAERQRASQQLEAVFEHPVLPVSAVTGEGLDELWILIDTLANQPSNSRKPHSSRVSRPRQPSSPPKATAPRPPKE